MPFFMKLMLKVRPCVFSFIPYVLSCQIGAKVNWKECILGTGLGQPVHLQACLFKVHENVPLQSEVISLTTQACKDEHIAAEAEQEQRHRKKLQGSLQSH